MTVSAQVFCAKCGAIATDSGNVPRTACKICGTTARAFDVSMAEAGLTARVSMAFKAKHEGVTGSRKWHYEGKEVWSLFSKTQEWHHISRSIDRDKDRYIEHIVDAAGNVIRTVDEPLSEHQGHGDAKR